MAPSGSEAAQMQVAERDAEIASLKAEIAHLRGEQPKLLAPPSDEPMKPVEGEVLPPSAAAQ